MAACPPPPRAAGCAAGGEPGCFLAFATWWPPASNDAEAPSSAAQLFLSTCVTRCPTTVSPSGPDAANSGGATAR